MKILGYSGDEAYRRISAMRFTKRNPEIKEKVAIGKLTLSTLNLLDAAQKKMPTLDISKIANGKCAICGSNHHLNFNHKMPHALGGTNSKENINLLCHNCNQRQRVVDFGVMTIFQ